MNRRMLAAAAVLGGVLGTVGGHATVSGMRADATMTERLAGAYGVPVAGSDDPLPYGGAGDTAGEFDGIGESDWTLGYRWAQQRALRHASACAVDSWTFQHGCEAAIRDRALDAT